MTHWAGARTGWNTRGGPSTKEAMREARERSNPMSEHWHDAALVEIGKLAAYIGDGYDLWAEMQRTDATWKEIYENCYQTLNTPLSDIYAELECSCNGVQEPCRVCRAYARLNITVDAEPVA